MPTWERDLMLQHCDKSLRTYDPTQFKTSPTAAVECVTSTQVVEEKEMWRSAYDSIHLFYAAHEGQHPDIRLYAAVSRELGIEVLVKETRPGEPFDSETGDLIVKQIALHRGLKTEGKIELH